MEGFKQDGVLIPYITLSIKNAKRIIWPMLEELDRQYNLNLEFKRTELTVTLPNRSQIWLCGLADPDDMEKLRGPRYPLVILDECQSMRSYLKVCIEDVLEPATLDYGLTASIVMFGTPNASSSGYFYECDHFSSAWGKAHWTMLQNPHLPHAQEWLTQKKIENGWDNDTPIYRREYRGEWVRDEETLVYHFSKEKHCMSKDSPKFPKIEDCTLILGVDLGYADDTSFTVVGFKPDEKVAYVFYSDKKKHMITDDIAHEIRRLEKLFSIKGRENTFARKVVDSGGLGKMILEEMNRRFGLGLAAAEKSSKLEFIRLLNADFRLQRIKIGVETCQGLVDELQLLEWNQTHMAKGRYIENDSCDNHCADSMLYAWRECYHYLSMAVETHKKYSMPWWLAKEDEYEQSAIDELEGDGEDWWDKEYKKMEGNLWN
tara:strand:+ start:1887 stop:3179 length:1293 start_codon:yes stop_codon:yes gene_type:complete